MEKGGEIMPINQNNAKIIEQSSQRLKALRKHVTATKATMTVDGQPYKLADLIAAYQDAIDTREALIEHRAAFDKALAARDSADLTRLTIDQGLRAWVATQFGARSTQAQEFGFLPRKVGTVSVKTKSHAVDQSLATREARGTKGKREKAKIKGVVTVAAPAVPATINPSPSGASPANGAGTSH
jgi:hypothetical protein